jgi:uncharacterized protein YeeX (DUF496 family)
MIEVLNAVWATTEIQKMRRMHRIKSLQSVLKRVSDRLKESNLLINLMEEKSLTKFMSTPTLHDIVQWMKTTIKKRQTDYQKNE